MLATKEIGEALGEMLQANTTLTELDVSKNALDHYGRQWPGADGSGFAQGICKGLSGSRAISTFTFSGDSNDSKPVTMETSMVEADFGGKYLGASGAIMAAAFLPKCKCM